MPFATDSVLAEVDQISEGEVISTSPHNVDSYDKFEDGLIIGLFSKLEAGSADNLDGSVTPVIIGVPKRKLNKAIGSDAYVTTPVDGLTDKVADICNFGRVTVVLSDIAIAADTVAQGDQVYVINSATPALAGKVTSDSAEADALVVTGAVFNREKKSGIWVITIQNYLV